MAKNVSQQFDACMPNIEKEVDSVIIAHMEQFGDDMVNRVLPEQAEFRNLTGNTLTSYSYGIYLNGALQLMSYFNGKSAIRRKLKKGEIVRDFVDYDGNYRTYFQANIDTDADFGVNSASLFLQTYKPKAKYSIIFTTGTEYSAYLENVRDLNVLTEGFEYSKNAFLSSFKPI
ncbi:MAG: hypothetical protein QM660_10825 [Dysgonomonas sp.]